MENYEEFTHTFAPKIRQNRLIFSKSRKFTFARLTAQEGNAIIFERVKELNMFKPKMTSWGERRG